MTTPSISSSKTSSSSSGTTGPSSSGSIKNQLFSSSGGTAASWSTETASSFSVRPTVTDSASSVPAVPDDFYDAQLSPATLTSNLARDVILTLSHDFANDIADRLSLGTCPTYDPRPSEPIIEKRQTLTRNPCAVARSKRGIASIGGGTPLFRALLNLPRTFPILVSPLNDDVQDISLYVMNLLAWKNVTEPAIEATSEVFYLLALKREMNEPNEGITVNTIMHYDIAQMGGPSPTIMSSVSSTAASTTQALSLTCPSNTFYEPVATIVPFCCSTKFCNAAPGAKICGPGPYYDCPCLGLITYNADYFESPGGWASKQAMLSEIAAYTGTPPAFTSAPTSTPTSESTTPPPNPLTCQSTGTYLMQYATATSAASAYCTAMAPRVTQGTAQIACAIQNKDPPYAVGNYPVCHNQSDIRFQIINDNRDTAACQGATIKNKFSIESCVTAYMNVLNQCSPNTHLREAGGSYTIDCLRYWIQPFAFSNTEACTVDGQSGSRCYLGWITPGKSCATANCIDSGSTLTLCTDGDIASDQGNCDEFCVGGTCSYFYYPGQEGTYGESGYECGSCLS